MDKRKEAYQKLLKPQSILKSYKLAVDFIIPSFTDDEFHVSAECEFKTREEIIQFLKSDLYGIPEDCIKQLENNSNMITWSYVTKRRIIKKICTIKECQGILDSSDKRGVNFLLDKNCPININFDELLNVLQQNNCEIKNSLIKSSYKDFNYQDIRNYVMNIDAEGLVECETAQEVVDYLEEYLAPIDVEIYQEGEVKPDDGKPGVTEYIRFGGFCSDNKVRVEIYADRVATISYDESYCDENEDEISAEDVARIFLKQLAQVIVHEKTHQYQYSKHWDRPHSNDAYESMSNYGIDYLMNRDEISAHILGGLIELLDKGYTKQDLIEAFKLDPNEDENAIENLMYETSQLKDYNFTMRVKGMKQFWKELYNAIQNLPDDN